MTNNEREPVLLTKEMADHLLATVYRKDPRPNNVRSALQAIKYGEAVVVPAGAGAAPAPAQWREVVETCGSKPSPAVGQEPPVCPDCGSNAREPNWYCRAGHGPAPAAVGQAGSEVCSKCRVPQGRGWIYCPFCGCDYSDTVGSKPSE